MNCIRVRQDRIYINCRRRVLIYLTAALCAAVFAASPSAALTRSEDGFYLIATAAELAEFRDMVNRGNNGISAKLTADIDLSVDGEPSEWKPIGNPSFNGTFDGGGHTVSGYVVKEPIWSGEKYNNVKIYYSGFFSQVYGSVKVSNLILIGDVDVTADGYLRTGGVTGALRESGSSIISNCSHYGAVKSVGTASTYSGGITGYNDGKIINAFHSGEVFAKSKGTSTSAYAGGVVGRNFHNSQEMITNCCWQPGDPTEDGYASCGVGNYSEWNVPKVDESAQQDVPIVTTLAAVARNSSVAIEANQSATISLVTKPDTPQNLSDYIVNPNVVANSYNGDIIEVINNNDLTFTVKPLSVGETPVTLSATLYPTNFSNAANAEDDSLKQQLETTVNIEVTETPTTPPVSGNGGGCSAGFGVPAFAALAVLILLRKRI